MQAIKRGYLRVLSILVLAGALLAWTIYPLALKNRSVYLPHVLKNWQASMLEDRLLISEVLYDPDGLQPDAEWVELFYQGSHDLQLVDLKIGDAEVRGDREGMFHFPPGSIISSGEVITIAYQAVVFEANYDFKPDFEISASDPAVPDMVKYRDWAGGSFNLSSTGDEVLLLDSHDQIIDAVSWGDSSFAFDPPVKRVSRGHSIERVPVVDDFNQAKDWIDQIYPSPGRVWLSPPTPTPTTTLTPTATATVTPQPCGPLSVLLTEVLYDPIGEEPDGEWFELFNYGASILDLSCLLVGDEETPGGGEGMYTFPTGKDFLPGEVLVVAYQAVNFYANHGFNPDYELKDSDPLIPDLARFTAWGKGSLNLSNSGDELIAIDRQGKLLDAVSWGSSDFAFDPPVKSIAEGHSISRVPANQDPDTSQDWQDQLIPNPGQVDIFFPTNTPTFTPTRTTTVVLTATSTSTRTPTQTATRTSTPTPTATRMPCNPATLLITEVLYDPLGDLDPAGEWIEIYNIGTSSVNLACVKVGDEEQQGGGEGMFIFPEGSLIQPGQVLVISDQATVFFAAYGFYPDYELHNSSFIVPDLLHYSDWAIGVINLSNSGDEVLLLDDQNFLVDALSWGSSSFAFYPSIDLVLEGHSLERLPADQDHDSATDWIDQPAPHPGQVNLVIPSPTPTLTSSPTRTPTPTPIYIGGMIINEIHADPDALLGDANDDGQIGTVEDEFIELVNTTGDVLDISGWRIEDFVGTRHIFPAPTLLKPNCGVVIFGGGNPQGSFGNMLVQLASTGNLSLNDSGDYIYLIDDADQLVTYYLYGSEASDDQSLTRDPDLIGLVLIKHTLAQGAQGALFSPGTRVDGSSFSGCSP